MNVDPLKPQVTRIRKVQIPEQFIHRSDKAKAHPTRVSPDEFGDISELETMEGQSFDEEFNLVDFKETDRADIPKTFIPWLPQKKSLLLTKKQLNLTRSAE